MTHAQMIGIEIGGTKLQVVVGNLETGIVDRWRGNVVRAEGRAGICRQIGDAVESLLAKHPASAIGVGFGGPVEWRTGRTIVSHQIDGWDRFELGKMLADRSGLPVAIDNDANVAALGEASAGAGRGSDPVFYVTLGSGVGGGCVVGGQIYHGAPPGEAEFGHLRIDRSGEIVEHRCSGWAVDRRIRESASKHPESSLIKRLGAAAGGESKHLAAALRENDTLATHLLADVAGDLGFALSHVVHLFHPAVIVIGGGLSMIGEPLRAAIAKAMEPQIMKALAPFPEIRLASLGEDAVPMGALRLAQSAQTRALAE